MCKLLIKLLLLLYPYTALGIVNFSFDKKAINESSLICLSAEFDDGTKERIQTEVPDKDIKEAYILLHQEFSNKSGCGKYKYFYKLLVVDNDGNPWRYKFHWELYNNKVICNSIEVILEDSIEVLSVKTLNEYLSNKNMVFFKDWKPLEKKQLGGV